MKKSAASDRKEKTILKPTSRYMYWLRAWASGHDFQMIFVKTIAGDFSRQICRFFKPASDVASPGAGHSAMEGLAAQRPPYACIQWRRKVSSVLVVFLVITSLQESSGLMGILRKNGTDANASSQKTCDANKLCRQKPSSDEAGSSASQPWVDEVSIPHKI
jgi:hypothetical protein